MQLRLIAIDGHEVYKGRVQALRIMDFDEPTKDQIVTDSGQSLVSGKVVFVPRNAFVIETIDEATNAARPGR